MADFGGYQNEIYFAGLSGVVPDYPMDFAGWEAREWLRDAFWARVHREFGIGVGKSRG